MSSIEELLHRLVAATSAPPPLDAPMDQLLALADSIAKEREPVFKEMSALLQKGPRLTESARALVDQLLRADRAWRERLDEARARLDAQRDQASAPRGRVSAYLGR